MQQMKKSKKKEEGAHLNNTEVFFYPKFGFFPLGWKTVEEDMSSKRWATQCVGEKFSTTMGDLITFIFNIAAQFR